MLDATFVGRALPAAGSYRVTREKVKEFALAIGEGDPVCIDVDVARSVGHPDVVAPPTFASAFTMPLIQAFLRDPEFGDPYSRQVHGDQSITLYRPIYGGDELVTAIHVEDLVDRGGSHMVTLRCEIADAAGMRVAAARALLVLQL